MKNEGSRLRFVAVNKSRKHTLSHVGDHLIKIKHLKYNIKFVFFSVSLDFGPTATKS